MNPNQVDTATSTLDAQEGFNSLLEKRQAHFVQIPTCALTGR
jgi:hypothetical protein